MKNKESSLPQKNTLGANNAIDKLCKVADRNGLLTFSCFDSDGESINYDQVRRLAEMIMNNGLINQYTKKLLQTFGYNP